jgi:hypothetical protein
MSRLKMTLLAAAAAALVATAVVALPAIGASGTNGAEPGDLSALASCLAAHGLPGAPTTGPELKVWLGDEARDPDRVGAAMAACQQDVPDGGAPGPDVQALISCMRSHGIDAPTAPDEFKQWMSEQQQAGASKALQNALVACKSALPPAAKPGGSGAPDCGAPAEKPGPPTDKPKRPAPPTDTNGT